VNILKIPVSDRFAVMKTFTNVVFLYVILLGTGGGVLLANCFCHWLPEVREGLQNTDIDT
jgi:hypothetical protein